MKIISLIMGVYFLLTACEPLIAQSKIYLYKNDTTTSQGYFLEYKSANPNGMAVLICPGGGYSHVSINHEGIAAAEWLNALGYDAFVLHYRVSNSTNKYYYPSQLNDVINLANAVRKKYSKLGVMGFSAGGHLAGSYLTSKKNKAHFGVLIYPVITSDSSFWHRGSFKALLGSDYSTLATEKFSVEKCINRKTPPLFFVHCKDDRVVPFKNSVVGYEASAKYQSLSQLHIYENGSHGFGMRELTTDAAIWKDALKEWLGKF